MKTRTSAREYVLQALSMMDSQKNFSEELVDLFCKHFANNYYDEEQEINPFFTQAIKEIIQEIEFIDNTIEHFSNNWTLSRMPYVDRNALRIGIYEIFFRKDIPNRVSINEAINLGKKFGDKDSGAFINAILDAFCKSLEKGEFTKS